MSTLPDVWCLYLYNILCLPHVRGKVISWCTFTHALYGDITNTALRISQIGTITMYSICTVRWTVPTKTAYRSPLDTRYMCNIKTTSIKHIVYNVLKHSNVYYGVNCHLLRYTARCILHVCGCSKSPTWCVFLSRTCRVLLYIRYPGGGYVCPATGSVGNLSFYAYAEHVYIFKNIISILHIPITHVVGYITSTAVNTKLHTTDILFFCELVFTDYHNQTHIGKVHLFQYMLMRIPVYARN